ncbi:hypothetical protein ALI22I_33835 [Saccharothrix sp. ALI-22-I]|uniref:hypothetical protein n=1 Tax=Saccharothrix sp. ALI-22-I TaxID=1933778 RepID=UPI00097C0CE7|nr:hypothetical protein [Saccharothrix sp. ALI-22-I]ONI83480.1 hypothetical protein ALI22I_33835 [Saccharothrix sp. ALI-22-I]
MTSTLVPTYRMRIEPDEDAENPRKMFEQTANVITVDLREYIPIDDDFGPLADQWRELDNRHDTSTAMRIFERYARVIHGAAVLLEYPSPDGSRAIWYAMPDALNLAYAPEGREAYGLKMLEAERAEYRTWARGEAVGYVIERQAVWLSADTDDVRDSWEEVESCWGFYDEKYAQEEGQRALDALKGEDGQESEESEDDAPSPRVAQVPDEVWTAVVAGPAHLKNVVAATRAKDPDWDVSTLVGEVVMTVVEELRAVDAASLTATLRKTLLREPTSLWGLGWNAALISLLRALDTHERKPEPR